MDFTDRFVVFSHRSHRIIQQSILCNRTQSPLFFFLYPNWREIWVRVITVSINTRLAIAGLILAFSIDAANQLIAVIFGAWIENSFGIALEALAIAAFVIGTAELCGEGIGIFFSDKFGKRRLLTWGIATNILACLILPFTAINLNLALIGLFLFFITFETSLVATIPLATELSPHSRAMYMTIVATAFTLGKAIMTPIAPYLFELGFFANCIAAVGLNIIAIFVVLRFIHVE